MLTAVKTTACGSGLRPVLTAAARGAVRCIWPGRRNRVAAEQRNPLIKCTHPEVPGRHLPRTLRIDLPERRWVSFIEHRGPFAGGRTTERPAPEPRQFYVWSPCYPPKGAGPIAAFSVRLYP